MRASTSFSTKPEAAPLCHRTCRARLKYCVSPVSIAGRKASVFIQPRISTSPLSASVVRQGMSQFGPSFGASPVPSKTRSMLCRA
ncbi:hypothetical protein JF542_06830 [Salipiger bermudensis]|nr:hypothetical protein [Salipiger bermudensis]MBN9675459.1 hypothetical protein [Salipiger bermudensis]